SYHAHDSDDGPDAVPQDLRVAPAGAPARPDRHELHVVARLDESQRGGGRIRVKVRQQVDELQDQVALHGPEARGEVGYLAAGEVGGQVVEDGIAEITYPGRLGVVGAGAHHQVVLADDRQHGIDVLRRVLP